MSKAVREYEKKIVVTKAIIGLKKQISRLEQHREKYIRDAKDAKIKGKSSSYAIARSGIKETLKQLNKLEVMLLNMELVTQQNEFTSLSGAFLKGMQVGSKELQKGVKKMNFVKTGTAFRKAFLLAGIAEEGLTALLEETEGTYEAMSDSTFDAEIDAMIGIEAAIDEEMYDRDLEPLNRGTMPFREERLSVGMTKQAQPSDKTSKNYDREIVDRYERKPIIQQKNEAKPVIQQKKEDNNFNKKKEQESKSTNLQGEALRPISWEDFQGQPSLKKKLQESINAAKKRKEPLKHILLYGPPGLGKTTLAKIIAGEMGTNIHEIHGLNLKNVNDITNQLKRLKEGDILFIDEIHCVSTKAQEALYMALEDFKFTYSDGRNLVTKNMPRFTLIGATTHAGRLNKPFLDRISNQLVLHRYPHAEIKRIIINIFNKLGFAIEDSVAMMLAERCRGVPRIARGHCERLSDKALNKDTKIITKDIMEEYFADAKLDSLGLTENDIKLLENLINLFNGGPAGLTTLANSIGLNEEEIRGKIEPYLNFLGMLNTVPQGRVATEKAYAHLGYKKAEKDVQDSAQENDTLQEGVDKEKRQAEDREDSRQKEIAEGSENEEITEENKDKGIEAEEGNKALPEENEGKKYINFAEQEVEQILGELGEEYTVYNNALIKKEDKGTIEIDHIVVSPYGIFVIETKNHAGEIKGYQHSEYFTQTRKGTVRSIYNPILQNAGHVKTLIDILGGYPMYSVIVFSNRAQLDVDTTTQVCNVSELLDYLEDKQEVVISKEDVDNINKILCEVIITDEATRKEHVEAVAARKATKRALSKQGKCPVCQTNMVGVESDDGLILECPNCGHKTA